MFGTWQTLSHALCTPVSINIVINSPPQSCELNLNWFSNYCEFVNKSQFWTQMVSFRMFNSYLNKHENIQASLGICLPPSLLRFTDYDSPWRRMFIRSIYHNLELSYIKASWCGKKSDTWSAKAHTWGWFLSLSSWHNVIRKLVITVHSSQQLGRDASWLHSCSELVMLLYLLII